MPKKNRNRNFLLLPYLTQALLIQKLSRCKQHSKKNLKNEPIPSIQNNRPFLKSFIVCCYGALNLFFLFCENQTVNGNTDPDPQTQQHYRNSVMPQLKDRLNEIQRLQQQNQAPGTQSTLQSTSSTEKTADAAVENDKKEEEHDQEEVAQLRAKDTSSWEHTDYVKDKKDNCAVSKTIDGKYACNSTQSMVNNANTANMLSQTTLSTLVQAQGMNSQSMLYNNSTNSETASLKASANLQEKTGNLQASTGMVNIALAAIQMRNSKKHEKNAKEISEAASDASSLQANEVLGENARGQLQSEHDAGYVHSYATGDKQDVQTKILQKFELNSKAKSVHAVVDDRDLAGIEIRKEQGEEHRKEVIQRMREVGDAAHSEQLQLKDASSQGALSSLVTGVSQAITGKQALDQAASLRSQAAALAATSTSGGTAATLDGIPTNTAGTQIGGGSNTITGNGVEAATADPSPTPSSEALPNGNAFNPDPASSATPEGPMAGSFNPSNENGGGGGGGGVDTGGGTGPGEAETPAGGGLGEGLAESGSGPEYQSSGTFIGSGSRGGNSSSSDNTDLSSLLKDLLVKKDDPELAKNGILDFGKQAPVAPFSVLGRDANLFERVSEKIHDRAKGL